MLAARDAIDVEVNATELASNITIQGGQPGTATGDSLTIRGDTGLDNARWTPSTNNFSVSGETISVLGIENLVYDGESGNETLTVVGSAGDETFVHTAQAARDAGDVAVAVAGQSRLGVRYTNLGNTGSIVVDGTTGDDLLSVLGTAASETLDIQFVADNQIRVVLTDSAGAHVPVRSVGVANYRLDGLEGNDTFNLGPGTAPTIVALTGEIALLGGGPSTNDVLNVTGRTGGAAEQATIRQDANASTEHDILGLGARIDVGAGVELITVRGQVADGDSLEVQLGPGNNTAQVARGSDVNGQAADVVKSDSLPEILFQGESRFQITAGTGSDVVTFVTSSLAGATSSNYEFDGDGGARPEAAMCSRSTRVPSARRSRLLPRRFRHPASPFRTSVPKPCKSMGCRGMIRLM